MRQNDSREKLQKAVDVMRDLVIKIATIKSDPLDLIDLARDIFLFSTNWIKSADINSETYFLK